MARPAGDSSPRIPELVRGARALCITLLLAGAAGASELPRPAALEPAVQFWKRVYTEVDGRGGLIHDSEHMGVVYEVARFPEGLSHRARERETERIKRRIGHVLARLAQGKRSGLTEEEQRVLSRWPDGVSNATLRTASNRVRFQLGQADKFRAGLVRAGNWSAYIERVLAEHGVPSSLVALPHVESSYNPRAYSRVGAAGMWQFTRSTGRLYLRIDNVVDERMDPYAATVAAARLLRDNHRRLQSWPLAITAYNHGTGGMARAVRTLGTDDIATIVARYKGRTFGFASRNFYAELLAADEIHRDPQRYFGPVQPNPPLAYDVVETDHFYKISSLERVLGIDREALRTHNLALRPSVWNEAKLVPRGYPLKVPPGHVASSQELVLAAIPASERLAEQHRDRFHQVRRGETLSRIASRYGVSQRELVSLNNLRSRHRIHVGQVLRLPDLGQPIQVARSEPPPDGIYRVRRGDNLSIISRRFSVAQSQLVEWNRLANRHQLSVGQQLRVAPPAPMLASNAPVPLPAPEARIDDTEPADLESVAVAPAPTEAPVPEPTRTAAREAKRTEPAAALEPAPEPAAGPTPGRPEADARASQDLDPSNYTVGPGNRITVQAEETLGHYADWLEVSASDLRRRNRLSYGTALGIGRRIVLDFSRVTPELFEERRLEYHRTLQEEFFDAYSVVGTRTHVLRRGDSLWYLAQEKYRVPVWLLRQYNPDLDFNALAAGTPMVVPVLDAQQP